MNIKLTAVIIYILILPIAAQWIAYKLDQWWKGRQQTGEGDE